MRVLISLFKRFVAKKGKKMEPRDNSMTINVMNPSRIHEKINARGLNGHLIYSRRISARI